MATTFRTPADYDRLTDVEVVAALEVTAEQRSVLDAVAEQMDFAPLQVERCLEYVIRLRDVLNEGFVLLAEGD